MIRSGEPVDGFSVETEGDRVLLVLSNRYGRTDRFSVTSEDAARIGVALLRYAALTRQPPP